MSFSISVFSAACTQAACVRPSRRRWNLERSDVCGVRHGADFMRRRAAEAKASGAGPATWEGSYGCAACLVAQRERSGGMWSRVGRGRARARRRAVVAVEAPTAADNMFAPLTVEEPQGVEALQRAPRLRRRRRQCDVDSMRLSRG